MKRSTAPAGVAGRWWLACVLLVLAGSGWGQCLAPEVALINACVEHPSPNGVGTVESELLVLRTGINPLPVGQVGVELPFTGFGAENGNIGVGPSGDDYACSFKVPNVTALSGCDNVVALGPDDVIPGNATVVMFLNGTTLTDDYTATDFSNLCSFGETVYVLQNGCARSVSALANQAAAGDPLRVITVHSPCGTTLFTYNTADLDPDDGTFYLVGTSSSGNLDCDLPVLPERCPVVDTSLTLCGTSPPLAPPLTAGDLADLYPASVLLVSFHPTPADAELNLNRITTYAGVGPVADTLYSRQIQDVNLCASVGQLVVSYPACPAVELTCAVRNNTNGSTVLGSATLGITAGEAPFTLALSNSNNGFVANYDNLPLGERTFTDLAAGTYTFTVTDATGVTESCSLTIVEEACPLTIVAAEQLVTDCSGQDNTVIRLTIAGNDGPLTTSWSGSPTVGQFNGQQEAGPLAPGAYSVTVNDGSGCPPVSVGPIVVEDRGAVALTATDNVMASACAADARVEASAQGGTAPYRFVLFDTDTGAELEVIGGADAGATVVFDELGAVAAGYPAYGVRVTDAFGCPGQPVAINVSGGAPVQLSLPPDQQNLQPPTCSGDNDGSLSLSAAGGQAPYAYRWLTYPGQDQGVTLPAGPDQVDLLAGPYRVEITDANGCTDTLVVDLPDGSAPDLTCGPTTPAVGTTGGTVTVTVGGGVPSYFVSFISPGTIRVELAQAAGTETFAGFAPGLYRVVVNDATACSSDTCTVVVGEVPCALAANGQSTPYFCAERPGALSVAPSGGLPPYAYAWDPAAPDQPDLTDLEPGNYALTVTDANGCARDTVLTVDQAGQPLDLTFLLPDDPLRFCAGDDLSVAVTATGAGPFALTYFTEGADGGRDTLSRSFPAAGEHSLGLDPGGSAPPVRVGLLRVTDANGCAQPLAEARTIVVSQPDTVRRQDQICGAETVTIGGRTFDAATPADTFFVATTGICGTRYEVALSVRDAAPADTLDVVVCPATAFELAGEVFDANRPAGEVIFPRPGGCDSVVFVRLDVLPEQLGSFSTTACAGDTVFYGDRLFTVDDPGGIARFPGQAATGCDSLVVVTVNFRRTGEVRLFGDFAICRGDSVELRFVYDGPGSIDVRLRDRFGTVTEVAGVRDGSRLTVYPTEDNFYELVDAGVGGCAGTVAGGATVRVNDLGAAARVLTDPADFCRDTLGRAVADAAAGAPPYAFAWSNGPTERVNPNLLPGSYVVSVTDADGCTVVDSVAVAGREELTVVLRPVPPACPGENGYLVIDSLGGGGGGYLLARGAGAFVPVMRGDSLPVAPGTGRVSVESANGCRRSLIYTVPPALLPALNLPADTSVRLGDSLLLGVRLVNADTAYWSPTTGVATPNRPTTWVTPPATQTYTLHLRTAPNNCPYEARITVFVDERLYVYLPTAFSPNGDGLHDRYRPGLAANVATLADAGIYDRWGNQVAAGDEPWDGTYNGRPAPPGVYVFRATAVLMTGERRPVAGHFTLMR